MLQVVANSFIDSTFRELIRASRIMLHPLSRDGVSPVDSALARGRSAGSLRFKCLLGEACLGEEALFASAIPACRIAGVILADVLSNRSFWQ
jgi:hypothetical protein